MDRGKLGTKPSLMTDATRVPIGCLIAPANRHDSPLPRPSYQGIISIKGFPFQAGARWVIERTNSWHTRGVKKLAICTERRARVIKAFIALANAIIITRRLIRTA